MISSNRIGKRYLISVLIFGIILSSCSHKLDKLAKPEEMKIKSKWIKEHFINADPQLPFSFIYDGKPSSVLLKTWQKKIETIKLDDNRTQYTCMWTDSKTGLEVRCEAVEYSDFPAVEWIVYLKNAGIINTPILKNIQGLDVSFQRNGGDEFILNGCKGDFCAADSYEPFRLRLVPDFAKKFSPPPSSGKSCDGPDGWPYYNLQIPDGGVIIAVGWPGGWESSFTCDHTSGLNVKAGQQLTNLYLKSGEEIRTPLIALLFWHGKDVVASQNLWRHWYIAHTIPRIDGIPQPPTMQIQISGSIKDTSTVNEFIKYGIKPDICWRDAGGDSTNTWFPSSVGPYHVPGMFWLNSGTWDIDKAKYPDGFKPFTDWIHVKGIQFVLWFEPERVGNPDSWLGKNHPEWLLPGTSHGSLLNEGNPLALNWLINHIDSLIKTQGIDWYREDMNGSGPRLAWLKNDSSNRQGITENLYIQGHLKFWDALKRLNPELRIDACASGGRRNDLESMRRAVPLLRSDFQFPTQPEVVTGNQGQTYGLSSWFPFQGTGCYYSDMYSIRSFYMPGFGMGSQNMAIQQQAYTECRKIAASMLFGDYYPLTAYNRKHDQWIAWQFNRPEQGDGVIQAFRRDSCDVVSKSFILSGLNPSAQYEVTNFDVKGTTKITGRELLEKGLTVEIKDKPGAAVIIYKEIK
jgi:alpha-galactosidase